MPVRAALNVAYAIITEHADAKQKREIDEQLYGWGDMNQQAERALMSTQGGEG